MVTAAAGPTAEAVRVADDTTVDRNAERNTVSTRMGSPCLGVLDPADGRSPRHTAHRELYVSAPPTNGKAREGRRCLD
ncbi:hypothetical protein GCM10027187_27890 [Streptosporangium sandarakinum]